jgi:hypothetical protein
MFINFCGSSPSKITYKCYFFIENLIDLQDIKVTSVTVYKLFHKLESKETVFPSFLLVSKVFKVADFDGVPPGLH